MRILKPDQNCWVVSPATRVAFLIDGAAYFGMLKDTVCRARESIIILGWDIACNAALRGQEHPEDDDQISQLLFRCVNDQPDLQVYLLNWDFAMVYMFERKLFPAMRWDLHPRIHFFQDSNHPPLASQHQKIVVADDSIAFTGGFDVAAGRWDTRRHLPHDSRRLDSSGNVHSPIHDVQVAVDGEAARQLGLIARERWEAVTGKRIPPAAKNEDVWPPGKKPDLQNVNVGISRTIPAYQDLTEVREVEQLYLDSIAAAKTSIYLENQYFTSSIITDALSERLREPNGPEVLMVLHRDYSGWMERSTMALLRKKVLGRLRRADRHGRFGVFYPVHKNEDIGISVHSKVTVIDDDFVRVGSSNLSNRSMGFDSECDVSIEAEDRQDLKEGILHFRNSLIAEHLGVTTARFTEELLERKSLLGTIRSLKSDGKTLASIREKLPRWAEKLVPSKPFFDPDRALSPSRKLIRWARKNSLPITGFVIAVSALLLLRRHRNA